MCAKTELQRKKRLKEKKLVDSSLVCLVKPTEVSKTQCVGKRLRVFKTCLCFSDGLPVSSVPSINCVSVSYTSRRRF